MGAHRHVAGLPCLEERCDWGKSTGEIDLALRRAIEQIRALESERLDLRTQVAGFQTEVANLTAELPKLGQACDILRGERDDLKNRLASAEIDRLNLQTALDVTRADLATLQDAARLVTDELGNMQRTIDALNMQIERDARRIRAILLSKGPTK